MKPSDWRRTRIGAYLRHLPRIKHLRGGWLHRRLGDSILAPRLWHPERTTIAAGFAVGVFFSMMPMPLQTLPTVLIAFVTRVNLPAALVGVWVSNPLTTPVFLYLQYHLGRVVLGLGKSPDAAVASGVIDMLKAAPMAIFTGAMIMGVISALIAYPVASAAWGWITGTLARARMRRAARNAAGRAE